MFALVTISLLIAFTSLTIKAQSSPFMGIKGAAITGAAVSGSPKTRRNEFMNEMQWSHQQLPGNRRGSDWYDQFSVQGNNGSGAE
jgi:hypothetical protein